MDQTEDKKASPDRADQSDVMIDTSEPSRGAQKVELDLEDAPFLEEEEELAPEPAKPVQAVSLEAEPEKKPAAGLLKNKKLLIIIAAALVLLIGGGVAVKLLFFKGGKTEAPKEAPAHGAKHEPEANATKPAPEKPEIEVRMEPFWVEQKGQNDEIRFLIVRILLTTTDQMVAKEFEARGLAARNAVFYYLKNKDIMFLSDEQNVEKLKSELLLVLNQYVTDGKFDALMFEEYVVK
jgi:flagellar FliL protein